MAISKGVLSARQANMVAQMLLKATNLVALLKKVAKKALDDVADTLATKRLKLDIEVHAAKNGVGR